MLTWEREGFAKDANVEKMAKCNICTFRLQKFAKHAQGFGSVINCSQDAGNVRKKLQAFFEIPAELKTTPANN